MSQRLPLIAGNWKMNNNHLEAIALVQKLAFALKDKDYDNAEVVVLPPFTDLRSVQTLVDGDKLKIGYGAQDISAHDKGAYTGEISGAMLAKLDCSYVLVGHSERREYHQEDDALVNAKVRAAFKNDIVPILCVGEGLDVRKAGRHVEHVLAQLDGALKEIPAEQVERIVVAYEPVWAIGTGENATGEQANQTIAVIRRELGDIFGQEAAERIRILYGGSVKPSNIAEFMAESEIDGALVGGASLQADSFVGIVKG